MEFLKQNDILIKDKQLYNQALTHSSYTNEHSGENYERLEFLGDAVLQIIMSEYFYLNSDSDEGVMTKKRASYVCESALANYAKALNIQQYIKVGAGQKKDINDTIIADVFEAIIAVIYLENGIDVTKKFVYNIIIPYIENKEIFFGDYKSLLQELTQTTKKTLDYVLVNEMGPAHDKTFIVEVRIDNMIYGKGSGKSKKDAEQQAALDAYKKAAK